MYSFIVKIYGPKNLGVIISNFLADFFFNVLLSH